MANSGSSIGGIPPAVQPQEPALVDGFRQSPSATVLPPTPEDAHVVKTTAKTKKKVKA